jgi:protein N-lysine methyltransferase METTL21D
LATLGWDVIATDIPPVLDQVLTKNVLNNPLTGPSGSVQTLHLDWLSPPAEPIAPAIDLIFTADTVYSPELVEPLLQTLYAVATASQGNSPAILVCLERRDSSVCDRFFDQARARWNFGVKQIPQRKISKAMIACGFKWEKEDWDGIELWQLSIAHQHTSRLDTTREIS